MLAVQRLSRTRVQELAEEIWTVSNGTAVPDRPVPDPRGSRPGASALAAYRRRRHKERAQWRDDWRSGRAWAVVTVAGLGAWLRLRYHPSASARFWRRQALAQRRTAAALARLEQEGWLVLHDVALPGWSASLDHLVIGPTGVWAIETWAHRRLRPQLSWKARAVADHLAGTGIPVRPLLCSGVRPPGTRLVQGIPLVLRQRLSAVVRRGSRVQPVQVQAASARALEVLRPAA